MTTVDCSLYTKEAQAWVASGKKAVGTVCCYLPEEVFHAAGLLPVRTRATGAKNDEAGQIAFSSYSCPWARATYSEIMEGAYTYLDGLYSTNGCQQAQRIWDNAEYFDKSRKIPDYFLFTCPRLIGDRARAYYREEFDLMVKHVEERYGVEITDEKLRESVKVFNETRRLIRKMYEMRAQDDVTISGYEAFQWTLAALSSPKEVFNEQLAAFLEEAAQRDPIDYDARVLLVGSAMDDPEYVKAIEAAGALVVGDVTCFGSRSLWEEIDEDAEDIRKAICDMYVTRPGCPRMVDNQRGMMELCVNMAKQQNADGIVFVRQMNCDSWGAMRIYFEEYFGGNDIPYIEIEKEEVIINAGQVAIRVGALVEMLDEEE